jgi:Domain of unknown function (DUF4314)
MPPFFGSITAKGATWLRRGGSSVRLPYYGKRVDSRGSRVLQARVALGGKVGARVTLISTDEPHLLAKIGQAGEVRSLNDDGTITVHWDRGDESSIDVLNSRVEVHP